jgi:hypothetical protein
MHLCGVCPHHCLPGYISRTWLYLMIFCPGDADQVVSYAWGKGSHDFMAKMGLNVLFKTYRGMPHSATDQV